VSSSSVLRAITHAPFRVNFAGQAVSILGTWIQQVASSWLVYRLAFQHPQKTFFGGKVSDLHHTMSAYRLMVTRLIVHRHDPNCSVAEQAGPSSARLVAGHGHPI
jgi:hypothetical protein